MVQQLSAYQPDMGGARRGLKCNISACLWTISSINTTFFPTYFYHINLGKHFHYLHWKILLDNDNVSIKSETRRCSRYCICGVAVLRIRPTAECHGFSCGKEDAPPCLPVNIKAVDDGSVLRQQLASAFLHSAVTPAQRLDAAAQRAQYLWGLSLHVSDSLSVWVTRAAGAGALNKSSCRRCTVFWRFDSHWV